MNYTIHIIMYIYLNYSQRVRETKDVNKVINPSIKKEANFDSLIEKKTISTISAI
jgi:hypothetical protein